jgi:hypothetical protein
LNFHFTSLIKKHQLYLNTIMEQGMPIEQVLKSQIKKEHNKFLHQKRHADAIEKEVIELWGEFVIPSGNADRIWKYFEKFSIFVQCESGLIGVYSHIAPYTNKKGFESMAHYSNFGNYLRAAKKDEKPISYKGWFEVTRERFDIDFKPKEKYSDFMDFLIPKKKKVAEPVEPKPVAYTDEEEFVITELVKQGLELSWSLRELKESIKEHDIVYHKELVRQIMDVTTLDDE